MRVAFLILNMEKEDIMKDFNFFRGLAIFALIFITVILIITILSGVDLIAKIGVTISWLIIFCIFYNIIFQPAYMKEMMRKFWKNK